MKVHVPLIFELNKVFVSRGITCASSSNMILGRNLMVLYNIFRLHNLFLFKLPLTKLKTKT